MSDLPWYLLIHEIPARPLYLRVKIRKRLASLGAVALKDSVYVAPAREEMLPRLQEIAEEARAGGAVAHVLAADFVEVRSLEALTESFRDRRDEDYRALVREVEAAVVETRRQRTAGGSSAALLLRLARAKRRLKAIEEIDFFEAPSRGEAVRSVEALDDLLRTPTVPRRSHPVIDGLVGRTWVTRRGIQVDRIGSAWFIRRCIDPKARFRFVDPANPDKRPGELTYDMVDGDFTHEEDRCSFETLIYRTGTRDPALARVAEIVHEIDIHDGKYTRPETKGVQQMLAGMLIANPDDQSRLERGFAMFDDLYESFHRGLPAPEGGSSSPEAPSRKEGGRT